MLNWFMHLGIVPKVGVALSAGSMVFAVWGVIGHRRAGGPLALNSFRHLGVALKLAFVSGFVSMALSVFATVVQHERLGPMGIVLSASLLLNATTMVLTGEHRAGPEQEAV